MLWLIKSARRLTATSGVTARVARNIEVKARIDSLSDVRARLPALPCHGEHHLYQTDTFFHVVRGRLKLREFADGTGELIFYERPDEAGPKLSQYDRIPCHDAVPVLRALSTALGTASWHGIRSYWES